MSQQPEVNLELEGRISVIETHMRRLVGDDGNGGVIERIDKHLEKMEKRVLYLIVGLILNAGVGAAQQGFVLKFLEGLIK